MSSSDSCKDSASKLLSNDTICEVNNKMQCMSTADKDNEDISICVNCGKEGDNINKLKSCTACKLVKYCSRECQIAHRPQHKKECRKRAAELHDEVLFKQPSPEDDCPICFIRIPTLWKGYTYKTCCGKTICIGCALAPVYDDQGNEIAEVKCPFCRTPAPTSDEEIVERYKKRVEAGDVYAMYSVGCYCKDGMPGYPQDQTKALELFHRAADLGYAKAYNNIGYEYEVGTCVERDMKKANHYYEIAAIRGSSSARHNLGSKEEEAGNMDRALKHFMIAVGSGYSGSLRHIQKLYSDGHVTKEDYTKSLQSYQAYLGEVKNRERDQAAASFGGEKYRYC